MGIHRSVEEPKEALQFREVEKVVRKMLYFVPADIEILEVLQLSEGVWELG